MQEEKRKLAYVEKITELKDHPNADRLLMAKVRGWQVLVRKDEFKVDDLCVYCEVDSILPEKPEFEFLKDVHYRIKCRRFRGCISQGICFPMSILPKGDYEIGQDVTDVLEITKYEPYVAAQLSGQTLGKRPSWIHKTDEERIQNVPNVIERHKGKHFVITEKLDGTSASYGLLNDEFHVCSRKLDVKEDEKNVYWEIARTYDIENKLRALGRNIVVQGEIVGNGIQSNKYGLVDHQLFIFNIYDVDDNQYLQHQNFILMANKLSLDTVPIIESSFKLVHTVDELIELSNDRSLLANIPREGLIFRSPINEFDEELGRLSFKVISPDFLLKYDE